MSKHSGRAQQNQFRSDVIGDKRNHRQEPGSLRGGSIAISARTSRQVTWETRILHGRAGRQRRALPVVAMTTSDVSTSSQDHTHHHRDVWL